jgi:hypothetical protein
MARQGCTCTMLRRSEVGFHLNSATLRQSHRENPTCICYRHVHIPGGVLPIELLGDMQYTAYAGR